ncbi:hypothetical protein ACWEQL_38385 [Kitasatospora sp. NPDC004240]
MRIRPLNLPSALATAAVAAVIALAGTATPAAAHGDTIHLEIPGQDNGHVSAVATWENDHDPVTEEFAGTLSASSADGRSAGPWRLVPVPGRPGTYTTRETLPAGHWKVTVDCAFPSLGHGERELDIPQAVISDPTLPTPPGPGTSVPRPTATGSTGTSGTTGTTGATGTTGTTGTTPIGPTVPTAPAPTGTPSARAVANTEDTDSIATWAAVATAAAAVVLVAIGFALRRRNRGGTGTGTR